MATSLFQMRIEDELKAEAIAIYEKLGIDLPTAVRMFIKRSVAVRGIPFSMTIPESEYRSDAGLKLLMELSEEAKKNGISEMTLDEINAEIKASRMEHNVPDERKKGK